MLPAISIHAAEVPAAIAEAVLVEAAREFCRQTRAARADHAPITTTPGTRGYTLTAPANTELLDVISAKGTGSEPLIKTTPRLLQRDDIDWETASGAPTHYWLEANTLNLWPTPTGAGPVAARMAVMPALAATVVPDELARHYETALRHGTLARLLGMPRKPWTDRGESKFHEAMFLNEIAMATHKAANEHQVGVVRKTGYGGL